MKLNYFQIKLIAIFAMTIDHIAWVWVDTASILGQLMHFLGRLTAPLMCFLLVEGFYRSKNYNKYITRLFLFACLSQIPYVAMLKGFDFLWLEPELFFFKLNILFNLLLALLSLIIIYKTKFSNMVKISGVFLFLFLSQAMDWNVFIIIFTLVFAYYRNSREKQIFAYLITAMALLILVDLGIVHGLPTLVLQWMPVGILLVPLILKYCSYEFGTHWGGRYFFYVYYPAHMLILAITAWLI